MNNTSSSFHNEFFKTLGHEKEYLIVKPLGNPIILFSSDGVTPIASIHLQPGRGSGFITRRWNKSNLECDFQGIVTEDNTEINFILTNLTNEIINFNILKKNVPVTQTDPGVEGHALNQINEISPFSSYRVQSDQMDQCGIMFTTAKKEDSGGNQSTITVKEEEEGTSPLGTYFWLSVLSKRGGENEKLFKEGVKWSHADYIALKITYPTAKGIAKGISPAPEGGRLELAMAFSSIASLSYTPPPPPPPQEFTQTSEPPTKRRKLTDTTASPVTIDTGRLDIDSSKVGQIKSTGKRIHETFRTTGILYNFDCPSEKCKIGLSLIDKVHEIQTEDSVLLACGQELVEDILKKNKLKMLESTVIYKEEKCCICLDNDSSVIFLQCGHQCTCTSCSQQQGGAAAITKCPMCRNFIKAKIQQ